MANLANVKSDREAIEALIDAAGIAEFLHAVASVCGEKAQHIDAAWQDAGLARCWSRVDAAIERVANGVSARAASGKAVR